MITETEGSEEKGPSRVPFVNDPGKPANPSRIREDAEPEDPDVSDDDSYQES